MKFPFDHKIVLVTGASRGIGRAVSNKFAATGATVIVHYHQNKDAAKKVLSEMQGAGHRMISADMADPEAIRQMVEKVIKWCGRIDILVNNAGIFSEQDMTGIPFETFASDWELTIRVNLTGPAMLSNLVARGMMKSGGGKIVNVSSRGAFRGEPNAWAYGAAKAGLNALGQSMAKALAPHRIYVFTLAPGYVETDMAKAYLTGEKRAEIESQSPMNRVAKPEEIAGAIVMVASEGTEYMTGCILDMNGASYLRS
jgi:NAD(P)-dependent dehydrogenase (short-subunit alcohol dehydrogenase family)